jgi:hypothetical protein
LAQAMKANEAKAIARQWVAEHAEMLPGFRGAFVHGSANWLNDDDLLPATSDLDMVVVQDGAEPVRKPGKFSYQGVLLDVSFLNADLIRTPEQILGAYDLAGSFRTRGALVDPVGDLKRLHSAVVQDYRRRRWIESRCDDAVNRVMKHLAAFSAAAPAHDQVTSWLFATGVTTHVLLVAGLKNPTVRARYLAARLGRVCKEHSTTYSWRF